MWDAMVIASDADWGRKAYDVNCAIKGRQRGMSQARQRE